MPINRHWLTPCVVKRLKLSIRAGSIGNQFPWIRESVICFCGAPFFAGQSGQRVRIL
jgi:hypothetical protein